MLRPSSVFIVLSSILKDFQNFHLIKFLGMFSISCNLLNVLIKARTYTDSQVLMRFVHI